MTETAFSDCLSSKFGPIGAPQIAGPNIEKSHWIWREEQLRGCPLRVNRVDFAMSAIGPLTLQKRTCCLAIDLLVLSMIQAPKVEHRFMRYELSDCEWSVIKPMLPNQRERTYRNINDFTSSASRCGCLNRRLRIDEPTKNPEKRNVAVS